MPSLWSIILMSFSTKHVYILSYTCCPYMSRCRRLHRLKFNVLRQSLLTKDLLVKFIENVEMY